MCGAQSLSSAIEDMRPEFVCSLPLQIGETAFLDVIFCRVSGGCCSEECHCHSANKSWDSVH